MSDKNAIPDYCQSKSTHEDIHEPKAPKCRHCSAVAPDDARFCPACARPITAEACDSPAEPLNAVSVRTPGPAETMQPIDSAPQAPSASEPEQSTPTLAQKEVALIQCACGCSLPAEAKYCMRCGTRAGAPSPTYSITILRTESQDTRKDIEGDELVVGQDSNCHLHLEDEYVSRRHARISLSDSLVFLEDLGSSNGTFLRVKRPVVLEVGDEIFVGRTLLRLERAG